MNISRKLFDYMITFVNSQYSNTNSKGDFVLKNQKGFCNIVSSFLDIFGDYLLFMMTAMKFDNCGEHFIVALLNF